MPHAASGGNLHTTAAAYLKKSTACGGIRIQKLRHACVAQQNATIEAHKRLRDDLSATLSSRSSSGKAAAPRGALPTVRNSSCARAGPSTHATVAICIFGNLARFDDARSAKRTSLWLTQTVVRPSIEERVISANPGWKFDVFIHSWQVDLAKFIESTFQPHRSEYGLRADGRSGMFLSIERVQNYYNTFGQKSQQGSVNAGTIGALTTRMAMTSKTTTTKSER